MVVSVDTRRMADVESIDEHNLMVTVGAGITGKVLEQELNKEGYRWSRTRLLRVFNRWRLILQMLHEKTKYGNIEDIVQNLRMVTPKGVINQKKPLTRSSFGKSTNIFFDQRKPWDHY